ncbi:uncharacterized protein A1O9_08191 [Exophiala aquamarina CBS 119918]|uniref:GATA-type domain-containing protein n=1 Tax=Exophiala aquamarina CBS 119918 TaxID=1182545 RepID=A0A072P6F0_9EURO|nr:uncharacterized protein A1O9_08191 [Exophiala aquamarina CBS 119918]KEF55441.1 hypothetical protein A1O9_08191 [Exophiala aquamarina CBS 119918]
MATSPDGSVLIRTVRLKVLYTFDIEQKDNHLARYPHPLEVQTAFIDETSQIGVIDLRTCLEAVTTASPELTTHPDNDYTVYAYDYSEPDTPLVGQGMLSKALISQTQGQGGDNDTMVTGRVTKNLLGLFSKNAQETLEVKLRFTPVNAFPQRYRSGSISSQDGGRPQWQNGMATQTLPRSASPVDTSGLEAMQRMLSGDNMQMGNPGSGSRPVTPTAAQNFNAPPRVPGNANSRPASRSGMRQTSQARRESFNSGYYSGDENADDGPARKRAKTSKVDWPSKTNFNIERQPDSLRVAASTASSVRLHRPIAINPATVAAMQQGQPTEEPVRPPTPVPAAKSGRPRGRPRKNAPSNLNHGSQIRDSSPMVEINQQPQLLNVAVTSPEDARLRSVDSTPANIPSSPPVMPDPQQPAVTSPALPPMMNSNHDSGFMSGTLDDIFGDDAMLQFDDFVLGKPHEMNGQPQLHQLRDSYPPVFDEGNDTLDALTQQPKPQMEPPPLPLNQRPLARAQSYTPGLPNSVSSPRLAPAPIPRARQIMEEQQRARSSLPPQVPKSDPAPRTLQRAQTWAPDSDALMSEAPSLEEARAKAASKKKVGKEQTKARLENAIANGEMPPFCDNCGSIETPAWRRGYAKTFHCPWDEVETSLDPGQCCFKEVLTHNADGSVKSFRGYKVEKLTGDDDENWLAITLCNPCGLWLHKQKCPRPREKWQKKEPHSKGKRRRNPNPSKTSKKANGNANFKSDAQTPVSDDSSPADTSNEAADGDENENESSNNEEYMPDDGEPQLPHMPHSHRASSADPGPRGLQARTKQRATERQVQSSPGQAHGSEALPIQIGFTPKSVRRQLFPSPEKTQVRSDPGPTAASSQGNPIHLPAFVRRSPRLNKTRDCFAHQGAAVEVTVDGKENAAPALQILDESIDHLFEEGPGDLELPPMTPTPKRRSERLLLKTPSQTPSRQFGADLSPNAELLPIFRTPKVKHTNQQAVLNALLGSSHKDVHQMTPFSRSIHDALTSDVPVSVTLPRDGQATSKKNTPNKAINFDFPDLPSLKNSSPISSDQLLNFNLSEMTTDQLNSEFNEPFLANSTLPSSPPPGLFTYFDVDGEDISRMWDEMIDTNATDQGQASTFHDSEATSASKPTAVQPRRSPRKQVA